MVCENEIHPTNSFEAISKWIICSKIGSKFSIVTQVNITANQPILKMGVCGYLLLIT